MQASVLQLTDCHIGHPWGRDARADLDDAVRIAAGLLPAPPTVVLVTGDIANGGTEDEYRQARESLTRLGSPVVALPGNHDDRHALAEAFGIPPTGRADISHVAELGSLRIVALDTQRPGEDGGQFDDARRRWLQEVLDEDPGTPTILAMHHPPIVTGVPAMDAIGFPPEERLALVDVLSGRPNVRKVLAGHVHRVVTGAAGATPVLTIPATTTDLALDFAASSVVLEDKPPAFAVHLLIDGEIVSHVAFTADP